MKKLPYLVLAVLFLCCQSRNSKKDPHSISKELPSFTTYDTICEIDSLLQVVDINKDSVENKLSKLHSSQKIKHQRPKNVFNFNSKEAVQLIGESKTKITIPPNSFVYKKTGKKVKGNVVIKIKEYYKKGNMVLANLTTQTKDGFLESRGMIHVTAYSNGKECALGENKHIKVDFPTQKMENDFDYYQGKTTKENDIIWELSTIDPKNRTPFNKWNPRVIYSRAKRVTINFTSNLRINNTSFDQNNNVFSNWFVKNFIPKFKDTNLEGYNEINYRNYSVFKKIIPFDFDTNYTKGILYSNISRKSGYLPEVKKILRDIPSKISYKGLTKREKHRNNVKISITVDTRGDFNLEAFKKDYDFSENFAYFDYTTIEVSNLNWINCDRFFNIPPEVKTDYIVDIGKHDDSDVKIVFNNLNSIIKGTSIDDTIVFNDVPLEEEVTIIASKTYKKKKYYSITKTKISSISDKLSFIPFTKEGYEKHLKKLNTI